MVLNNEESLNNTKGCATNFSQYSWPENPAVRSATLNLANFSEVAK